MATMATKMRTSAASPITIFLNMSGSSAKNIFRLFDNEITKIWHVDDIDDRADLHGVARSPGQMLPVQRDKRRVVIDEALDLAERRGAGFLVRHDLRRERELVDFRI